MTAAGIDVCKACLDLAGDRRPGVIGLTDSHAGIAKLVNRLQALGATPIMVEATGGYEEPLLEACCDAGLWIARVNARDTRAFANATGELAKTDDIDARTLALMASLFADRLRPYIAPPPWQRELAAIKKTMKALSTNTPRPRARSRRALHGHAVRAVRWDPTMKAHYQQLRARGKLGKVPRQSRNEASSA